MARYSTDQKERLPYLATAMELDCDSWNVAQIDQATRDQAAQWLKQNPPLYLRQTATKQKT